MIAVALALVSLAVALAASVWTTAYALQDPLADLLWLQRERQWDTWWDTIEELHGQLDLLLVLDAEEQLTPCA